MAVLPLNSSAKLDQEPNPFEQSFSAGVSSTTTTQKDKIVKLPPVASITSPAPLQQQTQTTTTTTQQTSVIGGGILPKEVSNQFTWDTLRTGPLSPSMLQGPANPDEYYSNKPNYTRSSFNNGSSHLAAAQQDIQYMSVKMEPQLQPQSELSFIQHQQQPRLRHPSNTSSSTSATRQRSISAESVDSNNDQPKTTSRRNSSRRRSSNLVEDYTDDDESQNGGGQDGSAKKKTKTSNSNASKDPEDEEKRKNFLERNRIAALKCRQRKKQWLNNLQAKVEFLTSDNERLQLQSESLKEEIVNLKTLLLAHKECPVAQSNGFHASAIQKAMPSSLLSQQPQLNGGRSSTTASFANANSRNNSLSSTTNSLPRFQPQRPITTANSGNTMPPPAHHRSSHQDHSSMMAAGGAGNSNTGGSSSVLRF